MKDGLMPDFPMGYSFVYTTALTLHLMAFETTLSLADGEFMKIDDNNLESKVRYFSQRPRVCGQPFPKSPNSATVMQQLCNNCAKVKVFKSAIYNDTAI